MSLHFQVLEQQGSRRLGRLQTLHGDIFTPAFGPDATRGLIKNLAPTEIANLQGAPADQAAAWTQHERREQDELQFLLSNTYHLRSYPGDEFIRDLGGLHQFMQWPRPILTDSGGFQVFSLIHQSGQLQGKVTETGARFQDPRTGDLVELTPESAIDIQWNLGSDIMVVLDSHDRDQNNFKELEASVLTTIEWARQCKARFGEHLAQRGLGWDSLKRPLLFAVIQGGRDQGLRQLCTEQLVEIGFDGYCFGGWASNEKEYFPFELMKVVADWLPVEAPRYAMGVGKPEDIRRCFEYGYDLFDCVIPTRNGRHGICYTSQGMVRIHNARYKADTSPLDPELVSVAAQYPKSYLHHLFKINDALGGELLSLHNLKYYNHLMREKIV